MEREEARAIVLPYIQKHEQYSIITAADALKLLGEERYKRLANDKVRQLGPIKDTFYYWNVIDYIHKPDLNKKEERNNEFKLLFNCR